MEGGRGGFLSMVYFDEVGFNAQGLASGLPVEI